MTTLVLLHAYGGTSQSWAQVASLLPNPCLAPNLRGFGSSPAPPGSYDVASYVEDVLTLVEGLGDYVLVGHSMGGKFALATAARRPAGLCGLVLVAPSPPTPEPMSPEDRQRLLLGYGDRQVAEETVRSVARRPISDDVRAKTVEGYLATTRTAWDAWLQIGSLEDVSDGMGRIDVPAEIVVGAEDPVVGPEIQREQVQPWLARCGLAVVPEAGHLLPVEAPEAVVAAIQRLMGS